jgi:hypothetical protein
MKQTQSQQYASKVLRLNQWGKIAITIFSDEAIEHGIHKLKQFKDARYPYKYFLSEARQYSVQNGIEFNYALCNKLQEEYKMPADTEVFVEAAPEIQPNDKYYTHKETTLDYNEECRKWHDMVVNWDKIVDPKKKCAKGYELTYPGYTDWLKKQPLSSLLDQDLPDTLLYVDESKLTLLDAMRK